MHCTYDDKHGGMELLVDVKQVEHEPRGGAEQTCTGTEAAPTTGAHPHKRGDNQARKAQPLQTSADV